MCMMRTCKQLVTLKKEVDKSKVPETKGIEIALRSNRHKIGLRIFFLFIFVKINENIKQKIRNDDFHDKGGLKTVINY